MRRRGRPLFLLPSALLLLSRGAASRRRLQLGCDPCAGDESSSSFRVRPGTGCKEYVQCVNGANMGVLSCQGDTIYDQANGYCNWATSTTCVDPTCPPTAAPATYEPTIAAGGCPNPCPAGYTGFEVVPGAKCKQYVACDNGKAMEQLECQGDTVFSRDKGFCDWPSNVKCERTTCPPTPAPVTYEPTPPAENCENPCPQGFSGFATVPGSKCKRYASCENGAVAQELECFGETMFNQEARYCDYPSSYSCERVTCPARTELPTESPTESPTERPTISPSEKPTISPAAEILIALPTTDVTAKDVALPTAIDTPAPAEVPIVGGEVPSGPFLSSSPNGSFDSSPNSSLSGSLNPSVSYSVDVWISSGTSRPAVPRTALPTRPPTPRPTRTPRPTTPKPTSRPTSPYQELRSHLTEREDSINSVVLQSNGRPSAAYTFADFMVGLEVAVYQLPRNKAFFVGEGAPGRLPRLSGAEYGLVNIAAFLANAMEEGIRIDSCDEWNTDFMFDGLREKYPLSNSCGQHGRSYQDEECQPNEPFQCAANNAMQLSAVYGNSVQGIPPFMCAARIFDGGEEIFPGYYDSVEKRVIPSAYSNTLGRTDIEGCCWWGRGALLTRGRCITGKLDKFIGQGAAERGVYVYPDINFCSNPEAICNDRRTNELRWVLGMLEWSDRVQSYSNIDGGWTYVNELKRFVDGGMEDETFFDGVINILKRNCHDDSCPN
ncbi:hypothetical protein ACHAWF_008347, partial [Thalassiosira exigua]